MCQDCGCSVQQPEAQVAHQHGHAIEVFQEILGENNALAGQLRTSFSEKNITAINLMGSPGCGKTTFLESICSKIDRPVYVIEGDLQTSRDADRLKKIGIEAYQVTTGSACHLDAAMVQHALTHFEVPAGSLLFIENVGNLVCPAVYDIGCHLSFTFLSVPEGDDKVEKYPLIFEAADAIILSKTDLAEACEFNLVRARQEIRKVNNRAALFEISKQKTQSLDSVLQYLKQPLAQGAG